MVGYIYKELGTPGKNEEDMKKLFKRFTALLTAGVITAGAFTAVSVVKTNAASPYGFVGEDSYTKTNITVAGMDTDVTHELITLGSGGSSGYGANRVINIVTGDLNADSRLSLEVMNNGTYLNDDAPLTNVVNSYTEDGKIILAAVNGDWMTATSSLGIGTTKSYRVSFSSLLMGGEIWCSEMLSQEQSGVDFFTIGMTKDRQIIIGKPYVKTTITNNTRGVSVSAGGINRSPAYNALIVYNNRLSTSNYVPTSAYEVAVRVSGSNKIPNNGSISGTVIGIYPAGTTSRQPLTDDVVVFTARGSKVSSLQNNFSIGDSVTVSSYLYDNTYGNNALWKECQEAIGGQSLVMRNGSINNYLSSVTKQYPTNIIGYKSDGSVMMAMVTANTNGSYVGLKYNRIPYFCRDIGYDTCLLLDGGGSTTMLTLNSDNGTYVERAFYSDGSIRSTWNSVALVYDLGMDEATFDSDYYAEKYADIKNAFGNDSNRMYKHYIFNGIKEGRQASPVFSVQHYLNENDDLLAAFGTNNYNSAFQHYIEFGRNEKRQTAPSADIGEKVLATINSALAPGLTLGTSGTNVQTTNTADQSQIWELTRKDDGSYYIINTESGKALTLDGGNNSGVNVCVADLTGIETQRWFLHFQNDGTYTIRSKAAATCVLDINAGSSAPGANVQSYAYNGTMAQRFTVSMAFTEEEREFEFNTSSDCSVVDNGTSLSIVGIDAGTLTNELASTFAHDYAVYDTDGNEVTGRICSGYTVKKLIDGAVANSATIIITGDHDGDGIVSAKDVLRAKKLAAGMDVGGYFLALDTDLNGVITTADLKTVSGLIAK